MQPDLRLACKMMRFNAKNSLSMFNGADESENWRVQKNNENFTLRWKWHSHQLIWGDVEQLLGNREESVLQTLDWDSKKRETSREETWTVWQPNSNKIYTIWQDLCNINKPQGPQRKTPSVWVSKSLLLEHNEKINVQSLVIVEEFLLFFYCLSLSNKLIQFELFILGLWMRITTNVWIISSSRFIS